MNTGAQLIKRKLSGRAATGSSYLHCRELSMLWSQRGTRRTICKPPPIRRVVSVHTQLLTFNPMIDPGVAGEPRGSSPKNTGLPRLPLICGAAIPAALVIFEALPVGGNFFYVVLGIPGLLLLWNAAAIWSAVLCVLNATRHSWRSAWVAAALPLVAAAAAFDIGGFVRGCNYAGDVLHFVVARPY